MKIQIAMYLLAECFETETINSLEKQFTEVINKVSFSHMFMNSKTSF